MATHLSPEQNDRLREEMERFMPYPYKTRKELAEAIGVAPASLSDFLNKIGGARYETAEFFAQRVAKRPLDDIIGPRKVAPVARLAPPKPEGGGFKVDAATRRKAIVLLNEPPQKFSNEAIAIAEECTVFRTAADAQNPAAVAEAWRVAILGTATSLPKPTPPSEVPPRGTRRSRRRA